MISIKPENMGKAKYVSVMGFLFAVSAALNFLESIFSAALPAGMRAGLSNIVIMTAILSLNLPSAMLLVVLKAFFVFFTRGFTAGVLSFSGGISAFIITAFLFGKTKASYILTSVLGAVFHSAGQILSASVILGNTSVFAYLPILMLTSLLTGTITGIALKTVFPVLEKVFTNIKK